MGVEAVNKAPLSEKNSYEKSDTSSYQREDANVSSLEDASIHSENHNSSSSGSSENIQNEKPNGSIKLANHQNEAYFAEACKSTESGKSIDSELLSRPSWCNAGFALNQIKKGNAKGNVHALKLRATLHRFLFRLGCFIQKYDALVLAAGLLMLGACAVGLIKAYLEENIENLWVESGGELAEELQYTRDIFADTHLSSTGSEYSFQMLIQTGNNTLTDESLQLHLRTALAATQVSVEEFNKTWSYTDLCYKFNVSSFAAEDVGATSFQTFINTFISETITSIIPCLIIGPLDCFWDGAKLLETDISSVVRGYDNNQATWKTLRLLDLFNLYSVFFPDRQVADNYRKLIMQAGLETGYTSRYCLNPNETECPRFAPNYRSNELPDIAAVFNRGCTGFASELMEWPLDLLVGGIKRNSSGYVTSAQGLQTIFTLRTTENLFLSHQESNEVISNWTLEKAEKVLQSWQRSFVAEMYRLGENQSFTGNVTDQIDAFTETTAGDILREFSNISIPRLVGGYILMIAYACITLLKFRPSRSQGAVGIVGVLLVVLSVVAGLGICSAAGISFNAASTQVLPFLLLGLGVDDMFLMSHHCGEISVKTHIPYEQRIGECLKRVGVSVVLTSVAILSGFLFSLIIPMPALQAFVLQAAVVTVFNLLSVLIIFPAILSLDLRRRKSNKWDILCCFTSTSKNEVLNGSSNEYNLGSNNATSFQAFENDSFATAENENKLGLSSSSDNSPITTAKTNALANLKSDAKKKKQNRCRSCFKTYFDLSLSQFGEHYYAPFLLKNPVRAIVLLCFTLLLGGSIYGCTIVKDGLDLGDVLPRDTREHSAIVAQTNYFAFYNMYIITQEFDYPSNQEFLDRLHDSMGNLSYVLRNIDGSLPKYWLENMKDWLRPIQMEFDAAWEAGDVDESGWKNGASVNAALGYKLLVQTGNPDNPFDRSQIRCKNGNVTCLSSDLVKRLLTPNGEIPKEVFYNYLSAWVGNDFLTVAASQAQIQPAPIPWSHDRNDRNLTIPRSPNIIYAQMPFYLNNMRENEDFVFVINWVRGLINSVEAESDVAAYPNGYPFTFWQQYISLRFWLFISLACVILAVFLVLSLILLNPWAAAIMALFLAMIATELLGFMGATGVQLSAVPAVILVASIGLGVEFTVHITFAYITSCGSKNERVIYSVGHMIGPVVDGSISTLLGVIMLAWAEFDFIVTYFFQVLAVLILLGALNGLVLLPVVLSLIGPPPEISPKDGGSRLANPTFPVTQEFQKFNKNFEDAC